MVFVFDGKCKNCGAATHMVFDVNATYSEIYLIAKCVICGAGGNAADVERIRHTMDTLETHTKRSSFSTLERITLRDLD